MQHATDGDGDRELLCRDCGRRFIFTAGEQAFFEERQLEEPKRCRTCRETLRSVRATMLRR